MIEFTCQHCGKTARKPTGHVNRSRASGAGLYCDRVCFGRARRKYISDQQKKSEKRIYDVAYRRRNRVKLKAQKAAWHKLNYDPVEAAKQRKFKMPRHVEYCRQLKYRVKKREYDKKRRASEYGPAAEAYNIFLDLTREIRTRVSNYEAKWENGTLNKKQTRARQERAEDEKTTRHRDSAA